MFFSLMIIGITGTLGAGKGTIVDYLVKQGFTHYSVREFLIEEIKRRGIAVNRDSMVMVANDLRERYGSGYIVETLYQQALKKSERAVIESVRTVGEVESLRKRGSFILFGVDADIRLRYQRIIARSSETDNVSYEEFVAHEHRESHSTDITKGNLMECMRLSDYLFENSGTFDELYLKIDAVLDLINRKTSLNRSGVSLVEPEHGTTQKATHVRPSWDEYFLGIMDAVSKRATCDRGRSGCVIVRDRQILVTGYVGSPVGLPHCDEVGHQMKKTIHEDGSISNHCVRTAHAEQNAICQAAKLGVALMDSTLFCKMTPCSVCAKMIINAGIHRVVVQKKYHAGTESEAMFQKAGITLEIIDDSLEEYENQ